MENPTIDSNNNEANNTTAAGAVLKPRRPKILPYDSATQAQGIGQHAVIVTVPEGESRTIGGVTLPEGNYAIGIQKLDIAYVSSFSLALGSKKHTIRTGLYTHATPTQGLLPDAGLKVEMSVYLPAAGPNETKAVEAYRKTAAKEREAREAEAAKTGKKVGRLRPKSNPTATVAWDNI